MKQQAQRQLGEKVTLLPPQKRRQCAKCEWPGAAFCTVCIFLNACSQLYNCKLFHLDPIQYDTS